MYRCTHGVRLGHCQTCDDEEKQKRIQAARDKIVEEAISVSRDHRGFYYTDTQMENPHFKCECRLCQLVENLHKNGGITMTEQELCHAVKIEVLGEHHPDDHTCTTGKPLQPTWDDTERVVDTMFHRHDCTVHMRQYTSSLWQVEVRRAGVVIARWADNTMPRAVFVAVLKAVRGGAE
jgi:hypothetical protein